MSADKRKHSQKSEEHTDSKKQKSADGSAVRHPDSKILERGLIFFFYRPKVQQKAVGSADDVQRLYILLAPTESADPREIASHDVPKRLIVLGNKTLPSVEAQGGPRQRVWSFVDLVTNKLDEIDEVLGPQQYSTQTRGERHIEPARACGEGVYAIVQTGNHTHLAYALDLPKHVGDVQKAFRIEPEGSYVIAVKNPTTVPVSGRSVGLSEKQKAQFPDRLQKMFEGRRWTPVNEPELLNYPGAELLLIGASGDLQHEHGEAGEEIEELLEFHRDSAKTLGAAHVFESLHLPVKSSKQAAAPLKTGSFA